MGTREIIVTGTAAALLALGGALVFYGPGIASGSELFFTHDVSHSDIWHLNLPIKRLYQRELHEGRLPLWSPELGTGFPLHAQGQVGALYPFNLLLYGTLPLALAFNWSVLLHAALAAGFAAALARDVGAARGGALLGGIVFAFAGFFVVHVKHPDMSAAGTWVPLLLLLVERFARLGGVGRLVLLAAATAAMLLAGHPQIAYYACLVVAGWTVALAIGRGRTVPGESCGPTALSLCGGVAYALVAAAMLAAPQLLPTRELNALGPRAGGLSFEEATEWRYEWAHLLAFVRPHAFGDPGVLEELPHRDATGRPVLHPATHEPLSVLSGFRQAGGGKMLFWEMTGYVGIVPLLLAAGCVVRRVQRWRSAGLGALLAVSLLLALGPGGGLFRLCWSVVPGFRYFRFPSRFLLFAGLALALLAALGWTALSARWLERSRAGARIAAAVVIAIAFLDLKLALGGHNPTIAAERWLSPPPSAVHIAREEAGRGDPFRIVGNDPRREVFTNAYFLARGWSGDLAPYDAARNQLGPNLSAIYGLDNLEIFFPLFPQWMGHTVRLLSAPQRPADLDPETARPGRIHPGVASLFNVRYVLDAFGFPFEGWTPLAHYPAGERLPGGVVLDPPLASLHPPFELRLLRNDGAFPRAFLVPSARAVADLPVPDDTAPPAVLALLAPDFDPRREVLIVTPPGESAPDSLPPGEPLSAPVEFVRYAPQEVRLRVTAPRPSWLVLTDTYYPGWSATINGHPARIHRANVSVRAVRLDAGPAEVVFRYRPDSLRYGWIAALIGVALTAAPPLLSRRPARGRRSASRAAS